jgi:hypothetical protein
MTVRSGYFRRFSFWSRPSGLDACDSELMEPCAVTQQGPAHAPTPLVAVSTTRLDRRTVGLAEFRSSPTARGTPAVAAPASFFLTTCEAAVFCRLSVRTLERYRVSGDGPVYTKAGPGKRARVVYRQSDVLAWLDQSRFSSTSERDAKKKAGR